MECTYVFCVVECDLFNCAVLKAWPRFQQSFIPNCYCVTVTVSSKHFLPSSFQCKSTIFWAPHSHSYFLHTKTTVLTTNTFPIRQNLFRFRPLRRSVAIIWILCTACVHCRQKSAVVAFTFSWRNTESAWVTYDVTTIPSGCRGICVNWKKKVDFAIRLKTSGTRRCNTAYSSRTIWPRRWRH